MTAGGSAAIRFEIKLDDVYALESWRRRRKASRWVPVSIAIRVVGVAAMLWFAILSFGDGNWPIGGMLLAAATSFSLAPKIDEWQARRSARKSPFFGKMLHVTLTPEGYLAASDASDLDVSWESFTRTVSFVDGHLVFMGPEGPIWLPSSALSQGSNDQVSVLLSEKIPQRRREA